ncbi:uncharacterized protein AB9W97_020950 isoform 2-T2 [Spinachia spinachia]
MGYTLDWLPVNRSADMVYGKNRTHSFNSKTTSSRLWLPLKRVVNKVFILTVQASYNNTQSEKSKVSFNPFTETIIGPPKVSLSGCGNCIHVNISLPADPSSGIEDIKSVYYGAQFRVFWMKRNEAEQSAVTTSKSYTVNNLQIGTEYCVQVYTEINVNRNTKPSAWECTFTSRKLPSAGPVFSGAVAALVIVCGFLVISVFCLYYTGFLCKVTTTLPKGLISLSQGYTLTPERTYPDKIYICAKMEKQRNNNNPPAQQAASRCTISDEEEEEEEEEEGGNIYMDRGEHFPDDSSFQDSADESRNSKGAVLGGSGSLKVQDTEFEVEVRHWDLDQNQGKAEGTEVSFLPEGQVTVKLKKDNEEEDEHVVCESFGDINLFSVTLASLHALAACEEGEEEEEQNTSDFLFDREPLPPTNSERTLSHTHSQRETTSSNATYTRRLC